jgi:hypothetical protein
MRALPPALPHAPSQQHTGSSAVAKAQWSDIEALVKDWFDQGMQPERGEMIELAYEKDAHDDVIDALDTLNGKPVPSLDSLKQQLTDNGVLA